MTLCAVDAITGLLSLCHTTDGRFDGTGNVALNNAGTATYVPNFTLNQLFLCATNTETGELSNCQDSGATGLNKPAGVLVR